MGLLRAGLAIALTIMIAIVVGCGGSDSLQPSAPSDPELVEGRPPIVTEPLGQTVDLQVLPLDGRTDIDPHSVIVAPKMEDRFHKLTLQDMTTLVHWQFSTMEYGYSEREYQILQCRGHMIEGREYVLWGWPYILPGQSNDFVELARFTVGDGHEYGCRVVRQMYKEGYSRMMPMGNEFGISHNEYSLGYAFMNIRGPVDARVFDAFSEREIPNLRSPELRYDAGFEATGFSPFLEPGRKYRVETNNPDVGTFEFTTADYDWEDPYYPPWWVSWPFSQTIDWKQSVVEASEIAGIADGKDIVTIRAEVRGYDGQILSTDKISKAVCFNNAEEFYRERIEGPIVVEEGKAIFEWKISTELNGRDAYFVRVTGCDDKNNRGEPFETTLDVVVVDWRRP